MEKYIPKVGDKFKSEGSDYVMSCILVCCGSVVGKRGRKLSQFEIKDTTFTKIE